MSWPWVLVILQVQSHKRKSGAFITFKQRNTLILVEGDGITCELALFPFDLDYNLYLELSLN